MAKKTRRAILGNCGEYYVASYLSGMGLDVVLNRPGAEKTDIIVRTGSRRRPISIQVKTGSGKYNRVTFKKTPEYNYWVWQAGKKGMRGANPHHWYAFVTADGWPRRVGSAHPRIFFVPSTVVANTLKSNKKNERAWFWMEMAAAERWSGLLGYRKLKTAIDTPKVRRPVRGRAKRGA